MGCAIITNGIEAERATGIRGLQYKDTSDFQRRDRR